MRIARLSLNREAAFTRDPKILEWKFRKSGYKDSDTFLLIWWGKKRETVHLSDRITIESLPMLIGPYRVLYDLLFPLIIPFLRTLRAFRPDKIVIADFPLVWSALIARRLTGASVEFYLGRLSSDLARTRGVPHYIYERLHERLGAWIPNTYIAINGATKDYLLKLGVSERSIHLRVPNTIALDAASSASVKRGEIRERLGIPFTSPVLLSVGRLEQEKGFDELIQLFAQLRKDTHLIIVGHGRLKETLTRIAYDNKVHTRVHFVGYVGRSDIWKFYADADVFALLSKSEGLGIVILEAMFARVPVIGRPVGGIAESIGYNGDRGFFWDRDLGIHDFVEKFDLCLSKNANIISMTDRAQSYTRATIGGI